MIRQILVFTIAVILSIIFLATDVFAGDDAENQSNLFETITSAVEVESLQFDIGSLFGKGNSTAHTKLKSSLLPGMSLNIGSFFTEGKFSGQNTSIKYDSYKAIYEKLEKKE